jgi:ketosteroid isomerase-like protein
VLRVRNGRIVSSRDYHDHHAIAAALGQPQELRPSRT